MAQIPLPMPIASGRQHEQKERHTSKWEQFFQVVAGALPQTYCMTARHPTTDWVSTVLQQQSLKCFGWEVVQKSRLMLRGCDRGRAKAAVLGSGTAALQLQVGYRQKSTKRMKRF